MAAAILADIWQERTIEQSINTVFKTRHDLCAHLAAGIYSENPMAYPPSPGRLADTLWQSDAFHELCDRLDSRPVFLSAALEPPRFAPAPVFADLDIPQITTSTGLGIWLGLDDPEQLWWLADHRRTAARTDIPVLQNYRYSFAPKRYGPPRIIEAPKPRLKHVQKLILRNILDPVPPHEAAHGFIAGRSVLSGAQVHAAEEALITCDLKDFFLTTPLRRVHGLFRSLGYPWFVAHLLTGICSSSMPRGVFRRMPDGKRHDRRTQMAYATPHLPAGAPTSPALANLAAFGLDRRLAGLARRFSANYTRYADDLCFSGDAAFSRRAKNFLATVAEIARDEGYAINHRKTRIMPKSTRQQVTGVVVNRHNNIARTEFDRLKATLHNCIRNGPDAENRASHSHFRAHLIGRVNWAENVNPPRGRKLRALFDQISWDA